MESKQHPIFSNYLIFKNGHVKSKKRFGASGNFLIPFLVKGYLRVSLWQNGVCVPKQIHQLVAEVFIDNPESKPQINHIDGNKFNNYVENLEWCSPSENTLHAYKTGLIIHFTKKETYDRSVFGKPVSQFDREGNLINKFESIKDAAFKLNISASGISMCINGKIKTSKNFIWKLT